MAAQALGTNTRSLIRRVVFLLPPEATPFAVGGFVRDALLGRSSHDLDIAVNGDALAMARSLALALDGACVPLDEERQVARVAFHHEGIPWQIDLATLQGDLLQALHRRDFTVNAMAVPLTAMIGEDWAAHVVDPYRGQADLEGRIIRQTSPAVFREDGLRLLRAVRIAAKLDFTLEPGTQDTIRREANCLAGVAWERVRDELLSTLACRNAMRWFYVLDDLDLLCRVLPELAEGKGVTQPKEHHWDVFRHNLETVGAVEGLLHRDYQPEWTLAYVPWNDDLAAYFGEVVSEGHTRATLLKLAALLHDVAKPASKTIEAGGRIRFFGHHTQGAAMCRVALERLRLSRRAVRLVETMVEHHLRPGQMSQGVELPTARAIYRYFRSAGEAAVDTLYLNLADYLSARGPMLQGQEWAGYTRVVRHILDMGRNPDGIGTAAPRLLDGRDLMAAFDLAPGPHLGTLLEAVQEAQALGEITTKEEALALAKHTLAMSQEVRRG